MKPGRHGNIREIPDFDLKSVCWGYRYIFRKKIQTLYQSNLLGSHRQESTDHIFHLLSQSDQTCLDHVLKEILTSLNRKNQWILDFPVLFKSITSLGLQLADIKLQYGIDFFRRFREGRMGENRRQVENAVDYASRLKDIDGCLALQFIKGYPLLLRRLKEKEIHGYVEQGARVFAKNAEAGLEFMEASGTAAENFITGITKECRLEDLAGRISVLMRALTGVEFTVHDLGGLNSDDLIERGSVVVCLGDQLFLPASIRRFDVKSLNRNRYMLMVVTAAGMVKGKSFSAAHGAKGYKDCAAVVGESSLKANFFQAIEYIRIFDMIPRMWPGAEKLLERGLKTEFCKKTYETSADRALCQLLLERSRKPDLLIYELAGQVHDFKDTAFQVNTHAARLLSENPGLGEDLLSPLSFSPDMMFPVEPEPLQADRAARYIRGKEAVSEDRFESDISAPDRLEEQCDSESAESDSEAQQALRYTYDEWSISQNDYRKDFCTVYQVHPREMSQGEPSAEAQKESERVRSFFEKIKPELARREKRLPQGDYINVDLLVEYLTLKRNEPSPEIKFYEKPYVETRDLAVTLLLDVSGSTSEDSRNARTIDMEKNAAFAFAEGLDSLGDQFSISGFSSNGRERCEYYSYKDFKEPWAESARKRLFGARPMNATRMGAAVRHAAYLMSQLPNRRKLIVLITDGKPMDQDYDSRTGYAQADVRKACEENRRMGIETYAVCMQEDSAADMEFMFPAHRFVTLKGIGRLPRVLPKLYMKLTV